ncbi:MAG: hypothetical protein KatS3mg129_0098 [Leptospiraceae bacterium]|nr:MAG: hypothetical protein KatS3mg129_0098 [Leptospiraceae bacterium]
MKFKDIYLRVKARIKKASKKIEERGFLTRDAIKNIVDSISEEWIEKALQKAKETIAPSLDEIPIDFQLRQSNWIRKLYERIFPVSHAFRISYRYGREYLDEFMPISNETFIGRGSYKFVYALPWKMVVKISKSILPSDPICGSLFKEVQKYPEKFLTKEEFALFEYLSNKMIKPKREYLWFNFLRLGLERYHYAIVKENLPDLVIPTRFFMGMRYRNRPFSNNHIETIRPMDVQLMLTGKHLKEFAKGGKKIQHKNKLLRYIIPPTYEFTFDIGNFGYIKKKILIKIKEDLKRLIRFTERLAKEEKLILDIHTENIIITIPEFELKLFDFHLFDEHLYDYGDGILNPEKEHIEVLEKFIESFGLE